MDFNDLERMKTEFYSDNFEMMMDQLNLMMDNVNDNLLIKEWLSAARNVMRWSTGAYLFVEMSDIYHLPVALEPANHIVSLNKVSLALDVEKCCENEVLW